MNGQVKRISFGSAKAQKRIPGKVLYIGYDTEYVEKEGLVCSQFYLKKFFPEDLDFTYELIGLLDVRVVEGFGVIAQASLTTYGCVRWLRPQRLWRHSHLSLFSDSLTSSTSLIMADFAKKPKPRVCQSTREDVVALLSCSSTK